MRKKWLFAFSFVLLAAMAHAQAEVRVLPHKWSVKSRGKGRVKVEIRNVDTTAVNAESITLNGIAPVKTKSNPRKVIAFFIKKDVLSTLGAVQKGQAYEVTVSYSIGDGPNNVLKDTILIAGKNGNKKKGKPGNPGSH